MKAKVKTEIEIEVSAIRISVAVRYEEEDIPNDFPMRKADTWTATVAIDTGKIEHWPKGKAGNLRMKVCDEGCYTLLDKDGVEIKCRDGYVPHGIVPGEYGDYIDLKINSDGIITNWPKKPDISEFFED